MAISKRLRFEILRRDNHACRYCGRASPEVKLTIDHVVPTTLGGTDDPSNLCAACADCNAGKSSVPAAAALVTDVAADALRWASAMSTAARIIGDRQEERDAYRKHFEHTWNDWKWTDAQGTSHSEPLPAGWMQSIDSLRSAGLTVPALEDAVEITMLTKWLKNPFSYFCGVAWKKVREQQEIAASLVSVADQEDDD
jgi:hypothetical protein